MAVETPMHPVEDSVAKVGNEVAVGEDLAFQRKWWKFEHGIWWFFGVIVFLDLLGAFGRGPLAKAQRTSEHSLLSIDYERVERFSTPSILTVHFKPEAVQDHQLRLWVSDSVIKRLGSQRISPQPATSITTDGGVLYSFPSGTKPNSVEFALQPASAGPSAFDLRLLGGDDVNAPRDAVGAHVFVMP